MTRPQRDSDVALLVREQIVRRPIEEVFAFFADAYNLEAITPPFLRFRILDVRPRELAAGTLIDYRMRLHGIPLRWRTRIEEWSPPDSFVDVQIRGPYASWHHRHSFESLGDRRTVVRDLVRYRLPLGRLGSLVCGRLVRHDLDRIFAFRRDRIEGHFSGGE